MTIRPHVSFIRYEGDTLRGMRLIYRDVADIVAIVVETADGLYEFSVHWKTEARRHRDGPPGGWAQYPKLMMFADAWRAFADVPELFGRLSTTARLTVARLCEVLVDLGYEQRPSTGPPGSWNSPQTFSTSAEQDLALFALQAAKAAEPALRGVAAGADLSPGLVNELQIEVEQLHSVVDRLGRRLPQEP